MEIKEAIETLNNTKYFVKNPNEYKARKLAIEALEKQIPTKDKLKQIIDHYGEDHQLGKLKEECLELVEAIDNYKESKNTQTLDHLLEEMADVNVVISEFRTIRVYDSIIKYFTSYKVSRQLERMKTDV